MVRSRQCPRPLCVASNASFHGFPFASRLSAVFLCCHFPSNTTLFEMAEDLLKSLAADNSPLHATVIIAVDQNQPDIGREQTPIRSSIDRFRKSAFPFKSSDFDFKLIKPRKPVEVHGRCRWSCTRRRTLVFLLALGLILGSALMLVIFVFIPSSLQKMMEAYSDSQYFIYNVTETGFSLRVVTTLSTQTPLPINFPAWNLSYGTPEQEFGVLQIPPIYMFPSDKIIEYIGQFNITNSTALETFGHNVLYSLTAKQSRSYSLLSKGTLIMKMLGFMEWTMDVNQVQAFTVPSASPPPPQNQTSDTETLESSTSTPEPEDPADLPFHVENVDLDLPIGINITASFNNSSPLAVDIGTIYADALLNYQHVSSLLLPDMRIHQNETQFNIAIALLNTSQLIQTTLLSTLTTTPPILSIRNISVDAHGRNITWLNNMLHNISISFPLTKFPLPFSS